MHVELHQQPFEFTFSLKELDWDELTETLVRDNVALNYLPLFGLISQWSARTAHNELGSVDKGEKGLGLDMKG